MKALYLALFAILALSAVNTVSAQNSCDICKDLAYAANFFIKYEGWNATEVIAQFEQLCQYVGPMETECDLIIQTYGAELANCLVGMTDPTTCCQDVGLCTSKAPIVGRQPIRKPAFFAKP